MMVDAHAAQVTIRFVIGIAPAFTEGVGDAEAEDANTAINGTARKMTAVMAAAMAAMPAVAGNAGIAAKVTHLPVLGR